MRGSRSPFLNGPVQAKAAPAQSIVTLKHTGQSCDMNQRFAHQGMAMGAQGALNNFQNVFTSNHQAATYSNAAQAMQR